MRGERCGCADAALNPLPLLFLPATLPRGDGGTRRVPPLRLLCRESVDPGAAMPDMTGVRGADAAGEASAEKMASLSATSRSPMLSTSAASPPSYADDAASSVAEAKDCDLLPRRTLTRRTTASGSAAPAPAPEPEIAPPPPAPEPRCDKGPLLARERRRRSPPGVSRAATDEGPVRPSPAMGSSTMSTGGHAGAVMPGKALASIPAPAPAPAPRIGANSLISPPL
jgi:hypothetical protein